MEEDLLCDPELQGGSQLSIIMAAAGIPIFLYDSRDIFFLKMKGRLLLLDFLWGYEGSLGTGWRVVKTCCVTLLNSSQTSLLMTLLCLLLLSLYFFIQERVSWGWPLTYFLLLAGLWASSWTMGYQNRCRRSCFFSYFLCSSFLGLQWHSIFLCEQQFFLWFYKFQVSGCLFQSRRQWVF